MSEWDVFQRAGGEATSTGWDLFKKAEEAPRGALDKLLGLTGERYQTWPERAVRDVIGIPGAMMDAAGSAPPGSREFTENAVPAATQAALLAAPVNPAIRAGDQLIPGAAKAMRAEAPKVPTASELAKVGAADIQAAKNSGLELTGSAVADYSKKLQQELFDGGIHPALAGNTFQILKELENVPANATFTAANLQTVREILRSVAQNFNQNAAKDQLAASRVIKGFDDFLPNVDASAVLAGSPAATQKLFETGRGNYSAAMRSNSITGELDRATTGILERAEGRAQAANSGRNLDNTIRSKVESLLEKPKEVSGFSDAEMAALAQVRDGGTGRNTARYLGNLFGGGGGIGQAGIAVTGAAAGGAAGGLPGAMMGLIPAAIGSGAKVTANALARKDLRSADEMMRMRSPLYEYLMRHPSMSVISPERRALPFRAGVLGAGGAGLLDF